MKSHNNLSTQEVFSKLRQTIWPIKNSELKKFLPTAAIMFLLLFCYTILRSVKDSLLISAAGAEVIPYLKAVFIGPISLLVVTIFTKMYNSFSRERIFYITVIFFVSFYLIFAFLIYPNRFDLQPDADMIESYKLAYPKIANIFSIWQHWILVVYYVFAEFWVGVTVSLLFWQFANEITRNVEAKRFYTMFALIGHLGPALSSKVLQFIARYFIHNQEDVNENEPFLIISMLIVFIATLLAIILMRHMYKKVLIDKEYYDRSDEVKTGKEKTRLSVWESFKYILSSKYIFMIFLMLVSYQLSMNLLGYLWKAHAKTVHSSFLELVDYNAGFYFKTAIVTSFLVLIYNIYLYRLSWRNQALITPLILGITTGIYFWVSAGGHETLWLFAWISNDGPTILLTLAATQNLLSRCCKYSIFDPIKEMTYIPCDKELRAKGKAAVDVFGYSFAKGTGGWMAIFLLSFVSTSIADASMQIVIICAFLLVVWSISVVVLSKMYSKKLESQEIASK